MEEFPNEKQSEVQRQSPPPAATTRRLAILSVILFGAAVFAAAYALEQSAAVAQLKQQNQTMSSAETQLQSQLDALTAKVAQMAAPPPAPSAAEAPASGAAAPGTEKSMARRSGAASGSGQDRRLKQMQSQLAKQQQDLKQTRDDLASARSDLEGKLGSTRDELNGSIARTHEELVSLEKRGERLYYEFDLSKTKSFQREGPIQLSLRKADSKHQSYDLMMLVDDHQLSKKKVDLYEPIWLHQGDMPQPVQVVVNKIDKNQVHGYVSAPKFRESELASNVTPQPANDSGSAPNSSASSSSPASNSSTPSSTSPAMSGGRQSPVD